MKRTHFLVFILMAILTINLKAQTPSINLQFLTDLSSLDLSAFALERNLSNQQKIFQVLIQPEGISAYIEGKVDWQENMNSSPREVVSFQTKIFQTRNFFSDELGTANDLLLDSRTVDNSLLDELIRKGKLTGVIKITLRLFSENGQFLDDNSESGALNQIEILNPTPTTINYPTNDDSCDVGNIQLQWGSVNGAKKYLIKANTYNEGVTDPITALESGSLIIDHLDVGLSTNINLSTVRKTRDWYGGQKVAVVVTTIAVGSGGEIELDSEPVSFLLTQTGGSANLTFTKEPDADMVRLAEVVKDGVTSEDFLNKLKDGTISMNDVQIFDENNAPITPATFLIILSFLEANNSLIISKTFIPRP